MNDPDLQQPLLQQDHGQHGCCSSKAGAPATHSCPCSGDLTSGCTCSHLLVRGGGGSAAVLSLCVCKCKGCSCNDAEAQNQVSGRAWGCVWRHAAHQYATLMCIRLSQAVCRKQSPSHSHMRLSLWPCRPSNWFWSSQRQWQPFVTRQQTGPLSAIKAGLLLPHCCSSSRRCWVGVRRLLQVQQAELLRQPCQHCAILGLAGVGGLCTTVQQTTKLACRLPCRKHLKHGQLGLKQLQPETIASSSPGSIQGDFGLISLPCQGP